MAKIKYIRGIEGNGQNKIKTLIKALGLIRYKWHSGVFYIWAISNIKWPPKVHNKIVNRQQENSTKNLECDNKKFKGQNVNQTKGKTYADKQYNIRCIYPPLLVKQHYIKMYKAKKGVNTQKNRISPLFWGDFIILLDITKPSEKRDKDVVFTY